MRSILLNASILMLLSTPTFAYAQSCKVPVCNISETLKDLQGMNGDKRGMFVINLKNQYKDSKDIEVLNNLYEMGMKLKELTIALNDDDWVQRAAADLVNTMIYNLARYSEVSGEKLETFYKMFATQTFRYNLISFWQGQVSTIEDISTLENLIRFADGARTHSIAVGDEDWVARAASSLISEITVKLIHLDPAHEGLYEVTLSETSIELKTLGFDRVAVLDSSTSRNLVVAFINTELKTIVYSYNHAEIIGNTIKGSFLSSAGISNRFSLNFDRHSGEIEGVIESTHHERVEFFGQQTFSTRSVFAGEVPYELSAQNVVGTMCGELAGIKGKLTVRSFVKDVYSATFTSDNGSILLNFQGKFFPKKGVLSLTSGDKIKLVLALRETSTGALWKGASFSTTTGTTVSSVFNPLK